MTSKKDLIRFRKEFGSRISQASASATPQLSNKRSAPATTNEYRKNKKNKNNEEVTKSIVRKLDQLLAGQRSLEERIINLEESLKNSNTRVNAIDKSFVKVIKFLKIFFIACTHD